MVTTPQELVSEVLALAQSGSDTSVSRRDLLKLAIDFANTGNLTGALLHVPGLKLPRSLMEASHKHKLTVMLNVGGDPEQLKALKQFRADLAAAAAAGSDDLLTKPVAKRLMKDAARMVLVPRYELKAAGNVEKSFHYLPESIEAVLAYTVLTLREKEFKSDFARCQLESCGKFFFKSDSVEGPGRHRTSYCCAEHMNLQHRSKVAERVKKHRENKAKAEAAKTNQP